MEALTPVIGLEVHVELKTRTKMFCACRVVDSPEVEPNIAVCEVCSGMPGSLPVINQRAVELAVRVALALGADLAPSSVFARKNYFYPDLPKGYQISQYEAPLASGGRLPVPEADGGERPVPIRRVHLEEDTGKLVHRQHGSLVDYNRSGVPLLEIVTEPVLHSVDEAKAFANELRSVLRALDVTTGDMEKGAIRFEANVSLHPRGDSTLGTRTEIKNLNSFRSMVRAVAFEIDRQREVLAGGHPVEQETRGWDDVHGVTLPQRNKEDAHDYRYFPEPDLPPLALDADWVDGIRRSLPELPDARRRRYLTSLGLPPQLAAVIADDRSVADFFEAAVAFAPAVPPEKLGHWLTGDLFGILHDSGESIAATRLTPQAFAELVAMVEGDAISAPTAKSVLQRLVQEGGRPAAIVDAEGLLQVRDQETIDRLVAEVLRDNPGPVAQYLEGKTAVEQWLFGQVMRRAGGRPKPSRVAESLAAALTAERRRRGG